MEKAACLVGSSIATALRRLARGIMSSAGNPFCIAVHTKSLTKLVSLVELKIVSGATGPKMCSRRSGA